MKKINDLSMVLAFLLICSCIATAMEEPGKFYNRARQNYPRSSTNNTIDELLLNRCREQERMHYERMLQAEIGERSGRLYQEAQKTHLYMNCSYIVCLGCCCMLIYHANNTFALSKKCQP